MRIRIRPGGMGDFEALMRFYAVNRSEYLPSPQSKDLINALRHGRQIVIDDFIGGLVGTAANIPFTDPTCSSFVGELTGTAVNPSLRGGSPVKLQTILLGLRVLHHAVLIGDAIDGSTSLLTIVKRENERSIKNILKAKFARCDKLPAWFKYDELAWHGSYVVDEWEYFVATSETVRFLARTLIDNGLLTSRINIETASGPTEVVFEGFRDLELARDDLLRIADGELEINLRPLPERLLLDA